MAKELDLGKKFKWMSNETGELQENIFGIIGAIIMDIKYRKNLDWKYYFNWSYNKEGF